MEEGLFATERTRRWRGAELREFNRREIETIEEYGHEVLCVLGDGEDSPPFAYTFGLFDNAGLPEMIAVGLPADTAVALLNEAAERLRQGVDLSNGRHSDLLAEVDCEFRPVDGRWIERLMLGATWFYDGAEFPVLQAVYPDLENRFPEDEGFDVGFAQPLLQPDACFGELEQGLWHGQR